MDYLTRGDAPFSDETWEKVDGIVLETAKNTLSARRFIPVYGPLGGGVQHVTINSADREEVIEDGFIKDVGNTTIALPQIFSEYWLYWRDLENAERLDTPYDFTAVYGAAKRICKAEDRLIYYGNKDLGVTGLLNTPGTQSVKRSDWSKGENAFMDVAKAAQAFDESEVWGKYSLIMGPDLYYELQRLQPDTGMTELERLGKLVSGGIYKSNSIAGQAALVCGEPQYLDIAIGQDMVTAYIELADMNHHFRIMETIALRIKEPKAIVVFK